MLVPGTWTWPEAIPVMALAAALLFLPGLGVLLLMRVRTGLAIALAPAVSTGVVAAGGMAFGAARVPWSATALAVTVVGTWALAALVGWPLRRLLRETDDSEDTRTPAGWIAGRTAQTLGTVTGICIAFATFAWIFVRSSGSPEAFPQQPDAIFHLALPQWMLENSDISYFHSGAFTSGVESGGYPIGMHDLTATLSMLSGAPVVVSTSAFVLVVAGVVWPLGMAVLSRAVLGPRAVAGLVGAAVSVLFTGYPFLQVALGVLWPNFYGQALMPAVLAATTVAVRSALLARPARVTLHAIVIVLVALPGLALAHFNAVVAYAVFAGFMVLVASVRWALLPRSSTLVRYGPLALTAVAGVGAALLSARVAPAGMRQTGAPGPEKDTVGGLVDTVFFSPHGTQSLIVLSVLVLVGALVAITRRREALWLLLGCLAFNGLYFANVTVDETWTRLLTWPWYNISHRLAAVGVLPAAALAAVGIVGLGDVVAGRKRSEWLRSSVATLVLLGVFVGTGAYRHTKYAVLDDYFHPKPSHSWASPEELRALRELSRDIPADAVVAANPWNGAIYLYVVSGRHLLWPTEKTNADPQRKLLGLELDDVGEDAAVCRAAQDAGVTHVITGGQPFAWAGTSRLREYAGVDAVEQSSAWERVDSAGPYTLYRRVACAQ